MTNTAVVILAAGKGKRMGGVYPKVLFKLGEKPIIDYIVETVLKLRFARIVIVAGFGKEQLIEHLDQYSGLEFAVQEQQLGTGHAVQQSVDTIKDFEGDVMVLNGDVPLISEDVLLQFVDHHKNSGSGATVLIAEYEDPAGYGRIVRDSNNEFLKIVEHKDASEDELKIREINTGMLIFKSGPLFDHLSDLSDNNVQKEFYITDMIEILREKDIPVSVWKTPFPEQTYGINTPEHLEALSRLL
ncbi:MAG: NTP transferase domain-containing protein [bacterium]|nr:NTP transferase domain-containing protein [bacterium]